MNLQTEDILGYPIVVQPKKECLDQIEEWVNDPAAKKYFVCANPHSLQVAQTDFAFKDALLNADLITPDGVGIVMASKLLGGKITDRVTGSDVFWGLTERLSQVGGKRVFFLGSTEAVLAQIRAKMKVDFPNIVVAGTYSPPFKPEFSEEDNEEMVAEVNAAQADVLWVGLTAPKQEKWIYENINSLDVRFVGAIGAVFDFYVGNVKRSHPVFQKLGLEWLPRLVQEPRRLWRRNFVSSPAFLARVIREKVG